MPEAQCRSCPRVPRSGAASSVAEAVATGTEDEGADKPSVLWLKGVLGFPGGDSVPVLSAGL